MKEDLRENLKYLNRTDLITIRDVLQEKVNKLEKNTKEEYLLSNLIKRVESEIEYITKYGQDMSIPKR